MNNKDEEIPEDIKEKLTAVVAQFTVDHDIKHDAIVMFMMQVIEIYQEYMGRDD